MVLLSYLEATTDKWRWATSLPHFSKLHRGPAAIHRDGRAGDIRRGVGREEQGCQRHLSRRADTSKERLADLPVIQLVARLGRNARLNRARANCVRADVVRSVVVGDAARKADNSVLDTGVGG